MFKRCQIFIIPILVILIVLCNVYLLLGYQYELCFDDIEIDFWYIMSSEKGLQKALYPDFEPQSIQYRTFEKNLEIDGVTYTCQSYASRFYEGWRYHTEKYLFTTVDGRNISFEAYGDQIYSLTFETETPDFRTEKRDEELVYEYVEKYCGEVLIDYCGNLYEDYKLDYTGDPWYYNKYGVYNTYVLVKYIDEKPTYDIIEVKLRENGDLESIKMNKSFPISPYTNINVPKNILRNAILRYYDKYAEKRAGLFRATDIQTNEFELGDFEDVRIFKTPLGEYGARGWVKVTYNSYSGYVYDEETDSFVLSEEMPINRKIYISTMLTSPDVIAKTVIVIVLEALCFGYIVTVIVMYIIRRKKSAPIPPEQEEQTE